MLPEEGSDEYALLQRKLKTLGLVGCCDSLVLDKLHTIIVNKNNRDTRGPKEEIIFDFPTWLISLAEKSKGDLALLNTAKLIRREGKQQSHCIGSQHYIDACKRGSNYALNYKGYTFYLSSDFSIRECKGKHNSGVPEKIKRGLEGLLSSQSNDSNLIQLNRKRA